MSRAAPQAAQIPVAPGAPALSPRAYAQQTRLIVLLALLLSLGLAPLALLAPDYAVLILAAAGGLGLALVLLLRPKIGLFLYLLIWPVYSPLLRMLELEENTLVKLWPEALLLGTLGGLGLGWLAARSRLALRVRAPDIAVALLLGGAVYAAFLTRGGLDPLLYGFRLTYVPMLLYFLTRLLPLTPRDIRRWLWLYMAVAFMLGAVGLFFHLTDPTYWYRLLVPSEIIAGLARKGEWRMSSLLLNPLYFAPIVAMAAVFAFTHFLAYRRWRSLLFFGFFVVCTYLSLTRGSYIMLALAIAVILLFWSLRDYSILILSLAAFLLVVVGLLAVQLMGRELGFMQDSSGEVMASRFPEFTESIAAFLQQPLGYGLGVGHAQRRFATDIVSSLQVYDGWYFKVLLEGGVLGLLLFVGFLLTSCLYLAHKTLQSRARAAYTFHLAMLGIMAGSAVQAFVTNLWEHYMVAGVLWVLLGLSVTLNRDGTATPLLVPVPSAPAGAPPSAAAPGPDAAQEG